MLRRLILLVILASYVETTKLKSTSISRMEDREKQKNKVKSTLSMINYVDISDFNINDTISRLAKEILKNRKELSRRWLIVIVCHQDRTRSIIKKAMDFQNDVFQLDVFWLLFVDSRKFSRSLIIPRIANIYLYSYSQTGSTTQWSISRLFHSAKDNRTMSTTLYSTFGKNQSGIGNFSKCLQRSQTNCNVNLHGVHLKISYTEMEPCIWKNAEDGEVVGIAVEILKILSKLLGFSFQFDSTPDNLFGSNTPNKSVWSGVMGEVINSRADMGATCLSMSQSRLLAADFTSSYMTGYLCLLYSSNTHEDISFIQFLRPFKWTLWLAILTTVAISTFVYILASGLASVRNIDLSRNGRRPHSSIERNYMDILSAFCQQGVCNLPSNTSSRIIHYVISVTSVLMLTTYTSRAISTMTIQRNSDPIRTLEELILRRRYKPIFVYSSTSYQHDMLSTSPILKAIDESNFVKTFDEGVKMTLKDRVMFVAEYPTIWLKAVETKLSLLVLNKAVETYHFVLPKDSPLTRIFTCNLMRLKETGVLDLLYKRFYLREISRSNAMEQKRHGRILNSKHIYPLFIALLVGLFPPLLTVGIEHLIKIYKNSSSISNNGDNDDDGSSIS
ncbi:Uncharacterised protein r2_g3268 [Pycnogonum litorale]